MKIMLLLLVGVLVLFAGCTSQDSVIIVPSTKLITMPSTSSSSANISADTCAAGEYSAYNGTSFNCFTDLTGSGSSAGDIEGVLTTNGDLIGGGTSGNITLSINYTKINNTIIAITDARDTDTWNTSAQMLSAINSNVFVNDDFLFFVAGRTSFTGSALSSGTGGAYATPYAKTTGLVYMRDSTTVGGGYMWRSDSSIMYFRGKENLIAQFCLPNTANRLNTTMVMGFGDSTSAADPTDGCYFKSVNRVVTGYCKNNAGPSATATTYTLTSNQCYTYKLSMNSAATNMTFLIYNLMSSALLFNKSVVANIPNTAARAFGFQVYAYQSTNDAAADILYFDKISVWVS
jgi:uncharacterized membrane protein (Fun14 family)